MSLISGSSNAAGPQLAYTIDQSIRFNDDDSAYLEKTFASAGDRQIWTWSAWIKLSGSTARQIIFGAAGGPSYISINENATGSAFFNLYNAGWYWETAAKYRDPSAWYHLVWAFDTTNATADNRMRFYVNGSEVTDYSTKHATGSQNASGDINNNVAHRLGRHPSTTHYYDGYLAEINFVDGQQLAPTDFGETNADTGQWVPKAYTGSYGTNGFYITGADSADLGADDSGNGNDFTSSGLTSADQRLDSPTLNKATLNGVNLYTTGSVLSDGNLTVTNSGTSGFWRRAYATQALSYKTYWEVHADNLGSLNMGLSSLKNPNGGINNPAGNSGAGIQNNEAFVAGSYANESGGSRTFPISTGNYIMFAFDPDRGALWAGTEGTWKDGTASSASSATILAEIEGTGTSYALFTGIDADDAIPHIAQYSTSTATARFSSEDWEGTAPTGYEQLAPSLLPDPTIADPTAYFQTTLYTGNGSTQEVNQSGNSTFEPGFVWIKTRSNAASHALFDQVRGVNRQLRSDSNGAEYTAYSDLLTAFDADGFTLGADATVNNVNVNTYTYAAWQWAADGTSGSSNTDGSITSTVSANTTSGFSIVSYTGTGANATVGHGLGVAPKMFIVKNLDFSSGRDWVVYHEDVGATKGLYLNLTSAQQTISTFFNDTAPTSSVFTVGAGSKTNGSSDGMIAYCFAEVEGFSKFGSYTGNSSTDGTFVYTGFRPSMILWKQSTGGNPWGIRDTARDPYNVAKAVLRPSGADAETTASSAYCDILSNGFKLRATDGFVNNSSSTYIYMAFAESPFKTATAR